ncbi:MAG: mechanosensitive ion channel domain-containing protein, partial [Ginsengibacter sp.]
MKELKRQFENFLHNQHISDAVIPFLVFLVLLVIAGIILFLSVFLTKKFLDNVVGRIFRKTKGKWDDLLIKHNLFSAVGYLVSVIVLKVAIPVLFENSPKTLDFIGRLLDVYLVFVVIKILIVFLKATEEHLSTSQIFIEKPIASYFQLMRIILYIIAGILALSILLNKTPLYFLGAFGAMTAVILLIFKDTILGLVASVQISANDMVRVGDWVEMPKYNADGDVLAINLNTVKVSNWDKTITTIPTYFFITESFKNWRGMQMSGGRRIKRTLQISIGSIKFVDEKMRERFKGIDIIRESITKRQAGIEQYNKENKVNTDVLINGVRMTNVGVFRLYVEKYIENHPGINKEMTMLVRQQTPGEHGLPIEIYCFTNTVKWAEYENIQSDIFDHLVAAVTYFDLTIFQSPTGKDFKDLV